MSKRTFIKPADGLKVRRLDGVHLSADGETVVLDSYWRRRLLAGDVVEAKPARASKASAGAQKPAEE